MDTGEPRPDGVDGQVPGEGGVEVATGGATEVLRVVGVGATTEVTGALVVAGAVVGPDPGMHWKYQGFCSKQYDPLTHVFAPLQPWPPHWPQRDCWAVAPEAARATRRDEATLGDGIFGNVMADL